MLFFFANIYCIFDISLLFPSHFYFFFLFHFFFYPPEIFLSHCLYRKGRHLKPHTIDTSKHRIDDNLEFVNFKNKHSIQYRLARLGTSALLQLTENYIFIRNDFNRNTHILYYPYHTELAMRYSIGNQPSYEVPVENNQIGVYHPTLGLVLQLKSNKASVSQLPWLDLEKFNKMPYISKPDESGSEDSLEFFATSKRKFSNLCYFKEPMDFRENKEPCKRKKSSQLFDSQREFYEPRLTTETKKLRDRVGNPHVSDQEPNSTDTDDSQE